jgi:hypothetical protein
MMIRKEISELLNSGSNAKDLVTLKFTREEALNSLNWKHHREFEFNGEMYDVADKGTNGDTLWFRCYKDHKETRLNMQKDKLMAKALGSDPLKKSQEKQIKNFFQTLFSQDKSAWNPYQALPSPFHYSLFTIHYSLFSDSPLSPPPKSC